MHKCAFITKLQIIANNVLTPEENVLKGHGTEHHVAKHFLSRY